MRPAALAALALAAVALAGCGGDDEGSDGAPAEGPSSLSLAVSLADYELRPADAQVGRPGTVTIDVRNEGEATHALEVEAAGAEAETEELAPGATARLQVALERPGRYVWYCPVGDHRERGMEGTITVARAGADGGDAGADPDTPTSSDDSQGGGRGAGGY